MTETKNVKISDIKIDGGTQPREEIVESLVAEYAEAMAGGAEFPPVVVFNDGVKLWLADGFHRTHAARRAQVSEIAAEIHSGTKRDAILYSVGANAAHGQRRTNADKRKAVMTLLGDEEWSNWSNRDIARQCAVSHWLVNDCRSSLEDSSSEKRQTNADKPADGQGRLAAIREAQKDGTWEDKSSQRTYTTKHGTTATMDTSRIGKKPPQGAPGMEATRPESRGKGLRFAHEAIAVLKKIPHNDGLRQDALDTVSKWIEDNR